jgi:hypothetical protein
MLSSNPQSTVIYPFGQVDSMEPADVYYFSGTGNTLLACREVAATLGERGVEANLRPLE